MHHLQKKSPVLLMVDDDREDVYLTKRAFCNHNKELIFKSVQDGAELFDYLDACGEYATNATVDTPSVILLDINIPKQNGFTLLERLKSADEHCHIPVSMFTTSNSPRDVSKAYKLGASSFICKSPSAAGMNNIAERFCAYWFNFAELTGITT